MIYGSSNETRNTSSVTARSHASMSDLVRTGTSLRIQAQHHRGECESQKSATTLGPLAGEVNNTDYLNGSCQMVGYFRQDSTATRVSAGVCGVTPTNRGSRTDNLDQDARTGRETNSD